MCSRGPSPSPSSWCSWRYSSFRRSNGKSPVGGRFRNSDRVLSAHPKRGFMSKYVGASVPRKEDDRLLRGRGKFVADIQLPGMVEASVVRSAFAHAEVQVDASRARAAPGVIA